MNAAHFIYIPVCILIGIVFGWILGSRAARDAYLAELRRREGKAAPAATSTRAAHHGNDTKTGAL
jgi:hypothetical protein